MPADEHHFVVEAFGDGVAAAEAPHGGDLTRPGAERIAELAERIYLFGSVARGDASRDSDYDLLIVVPDTAAAERRQSRMAYEALPGTGAAADLLVCTHSYFEDRRTLKASLPGTVLREG